MTERKVKKTAAGWVVITKIDDNTDRVSSIFATRNDAIRFKNYQDEMEETYEKETEE